APRPAISTPGLARSTAGTRSARERAPEARTEREAHEGDAAIDREPRPRGRALRPDLLLGEVDRGGEPEDPQVDLSAAEGLERVEGTQRVGEREIHERSDGEAGRDRARAPARELAAELRDVRVGESEGAAELLDGAFAADVERCGHEARAQLGPDLLVLLAGVVLHGPAEVEQVALDAQAVAQGHARGGRRRHAGSSVVGAFVTDGTRPSTRSTVRVSSRHSF